MQLTKIDDNKKLSLNDNKKIFLHTLFQAPANLHGSIEIGELCWSIKRWLKRYQLPG